MPGLFLSKKSTEDGAEQYDASGVLGVIVAGPPAVVQPFMALGPGNPSGVQVLTTTRDASDLPGDVEQFKAHIVLLSPEVRGYTPDLVSQLTNWPTYPLAVVGLVPATGTFGAEMAGQGAVGFYNTPVTSAIVEKFAREARGFVDTARQKWSKPMVDSGVDRRVLEAIGSTSYRTGVVTFWSTKGGDGKTVMAVNTACLLSVVGGQRVLLIDNDMNCGRVHLHLMIAPGQNTLLHLASDFKAAGNKIDGKMLKRRVEQADRALDQRTKTVESKLDVLFGIPNIEDAASDDLKGKQGQAFMEALLDVARQMYDFVVVDMGSNTQMGTHFGALSRSDIIMFVNSSDRSSLEPNRKTLEALTTKGDLQRGKFHMVLNRYDERDRLDPKQISEFIGLPIAAVVPEDTSREMVASVNEGKPFALTHMGKRKDDDPAEKTMRGLLDIVEEVFPPFGKLIAERNGGKKKSGGLFGRK